MSEGKLGENTSKPNGPKQLGMLIAKLSPAPASAGLRLALFPFDPATHQPTPAEIVVLVWFKVV